MGSIEAAARPVPRRSDAGKIRYTERDVTGLLLLAEHYAGVVRPAGGRAVRACARTRAVVGRWRPPAWRPAAVSGPARRGLAHHGRGRPLIKKGEMTSGTTIAALLYVLSESTD